MNRSEKMDSFISAAILSAYAIFFISVFFSFRAISSVSVGILLVAGVIKQKGKIAPAVRNNKASILLLAGVIFLLLQLISLLYTDNVAGTFSDIEQKSGLVLVPLAIILTGPFESREWKILQVTYCSSLLAAFLYCLCVTLLHYNTHGDSSVFFYHKLVSPLHQHAVYFSIFVFVALVFLLETLQKKTYIAGRIGSLAMIIFFSGSLFFLSSKLVISFYIIYLLCYLISLAKMNIFSRKVIAGFASLIVIAVSIIFLTRNPVRSRFLDIINGNLALVKQDSYTPGDYFNGVQFRLIQWKFVPEILNRHHSWWKGVGAANSQPFLNQEYISKNMYLGDPLTGDHLGYRAYNTHNQPLESLLSYGIPGLLVCLLMLSTLIRIAWQKKQRAAFFFIGLLLVYALIESVFETQYGIILFVFFPSFLCQYDDRRANQQPVKPDLISKN